MAFESTATCLRFHTFKADRLHIHQCWASPIAIANFYFYLRNCRLADLGA